MTRWWAEVNRGCCCCEQGRLFRWAANHGILHGPHAAPIAGINTIISYIEDLEKRVGVQPGCREEVKLTQQVSEHQSRYSNGWATCTCGFDPASVISRKSRLSDAYKALDAHRKEVQDNVDLL